MSSANVRNIDALRNTKAAVLTFAEEAKVSLDSTEMDIRHFSNWLERDQLTYWKAQVKKCQENVAIAKSELFRRQLSQSDAVSDTDQKEALKLAKRKLQEAEDMVERIKRWVPILDHAISEYHGQSQPLGDRISGALVNSLSLLDRLIASVESYTNLTAPSAPVIAPKDGSSTSGPASSGAKSAASSGDSVTTATAGPAATADGQPSQAVETQEGETVAATKTNPSGGQPS